MSAIQLTRGISRGRLLAGITAGIVLLGAMLVVGRWERGHNAAHENAVMARVFRLATAHGLISGQLDAYRLAGAFDCLLYHPPGRPDEVTALELCFGPTGRLIQTIDRRHDPPDYGDLQSQPSLATISVPVPKLLAAFFHVTGGQDSRIAGHFTDSTLPVGNNDIGARGTPPHRPGLGG